MPRKCRLAVLCAASLLLLWPDSPQAGIIRPLGRQEIRRIAETGGRGFRSDVSQKNLLGLARPSQFSLPTSKRGRPLTAEAQADTIHVLALKVEFQLESPDNPRTTGNGTFDLRSYAQFQAEEGHFIDPAPHNTSYFSSHLDALNRYWYEVSDRILQLSWDVYPQAESASFRLPARMSFYGPAGNWPHPEYSIGDRLGHFFIDAVSFVDSAAPEIDFGRYQSIVIFHAGSDQQNNIPFINDTPDDFFTGFLRLAEPIFVENGAVEILEAVLMPETVNQDNRINALNAVMAHEFGHQLGLVDLYKTENFLTQVGDFSLMDNNGMSVGVILSDDFWSVGGTIPVYPDAWSRAYLGFGVPVELTSAENQQVFAAAMHRPESEIIKIPITEFEYFLIENRQMDADTLAPDFPLDDVLIGDPVTNVILGPGYAYFEGNDTILVTDAEYDRLSPGNGMLIWHVDEFAAYQNELPQYGPNNFWNNTLQWNKDRRFVRLVEADGIIDFGGDYYTGFGGQGDIFTADGNTMFTPFTNPASRSNLGADTHVNVTGISGIPGVDTVMSADIVVDWLLPGWPQMSRPGNMSDPVIADLDDDSTSEVIMAAGQQLLIWRHDGQKYIPNADSIGILRFDSSVAVYPLAVAAECDTTIVGRPAIFQADSSSSGASALEIAVSTASGMLYVFTVSDNNGDGRIDQLTDSPFDNFASAQTGPIAVNFLTRDFDQLITIDNTGGIHLIYWGTGTVEDSTIFDLGAPVISACAFTAESKNVILALMLMLGGPPRLVTLKADSGSVDFRQVVAIATEGSNVAAGDLLNDGTTQTVVTGVDLVSLIDGSGRVLWARNIAGIRGKPALGDINSDGYPEIVVGGDSDIFAVGRNGALLGNFPIDLARYDLYGEIYASPVLADVDSDGNPDIIIGLPGGSIHAFNYHGDRIAGFPLPSSFGIEKASAAGDLDGNGNIDIVCVETAGFVKAWDTGAPFITTNAPWRMTAGDSRNSGYLADTFGKPIVANDEQLSENSVYCYPNPAKAATTVRYYLNSDSQVSIDIYDFMGERITGVALVGSAHVNNEYIWNCADVASGVYYCRVAAKNNSGETWRLIKIAVVN